MAAAFLDTNMNTLQEIFNKQFHKRSDELLKKFLDGKISEKFLQQGVKLDKNKVSEISKKILETKGTVLDFDIDDKFLTPVNDSITEEFIKNLKIDLTDIDIKEFLENIKSKLNDVYPKIIEDFSKKLFTQFKSQAHNEVETFRKERGEFQKGLEKLWRKPFILFEMYLSLVFDVGNSCNEEYRKICSKNPDIVFDVLIKLHARCSQIALEVLTLMKAGFADGAHARWRTLHEIAVVSLFIEKHGKTAAEMYYDHNSVESYKAALQYQKYAKALKQKEIPKKEMDAIKKEYDRVITKYGTDFKESYGWVSTILGKSRPTFADIENNVGLDKWRPYYKMASHNVHANPKGITSKLGLSDKTSTILLAGASDYGFTDPAHGTAISLLQATSTFLLKNSNIDRLVMMDVLRRFERLIGEEFLKVQNKYEAKFNK
jgi:hypothetical protein